MPVQPIRQNVHVPLQRRHQHLRGQFDLQGIKCGDDAPLEIPKSDPSKALRIVFVTLWKESFYTSTDWTTTKLHSQEDQDAYCR